MVVETLSDHGIKMVSLTFLSSLIVKQDHVAS